MASMASPVDLIEDGGVKKLILKAAQTVDEKPTKGQECVVHYTGSFLDGKQFDSSYSKGIPFTFELGNNQVIRGWDIGVATMSPGEKAKFTIQPEYAYGEAGGPTIPPNSTLEFDIELIEFRDKKKDKYLMTPEEKLQEALESLAKGNDSFRRQEIQKAISHYLSGVQMFENPDEFPDSIQGNCKSTQTSLHLNLSNCFSKTNAYKDAVAHATLALAFSPNNCKALFRRGFANYNLQEYSAAKTDLIKAARIEPQNTEIRRQLALVKEGIRQAELKDKKLFSSLFSKRTHTEKKGLDIAKPEPSKTGESNRVFFDIQIGDGPVKRLTFELYDKDVPKTAENFRKLCVGDQVFENNPSIKLAYQNSKFHRVIRGFMMQGGDFTNGDGTGGMSIYGRKFDDENFIHRHNRRGLLSMANAGPNTNGSQFFITFTATPHLDGRHTVFGEVVDGMNILDDVEKLETDISDRPKKDVTIVNSGILRPVTE